MLNDAQLDTMESEVRLAVQVEFFDGHELRSLIAQSREANRLREENAAIKAIGVTMELRSCCCTKYAKELSRLRPVVEAAKAWMIARENYYASKEYEDGPLYDAKCATEDALVDLIPRLAATERAGESPPARAERKEESGG